MSIKIIDKINAIKQAEAEAEANGTAPEKKTTYYSYEYFPPKTPAGKLIDLIEFNFVCFKVRKIWLRELEEWRQQIHCGLM